MGLFSKDNDYNLILEKVLDSKYFSSSAKSLFLSMIYKIESCYKDFQNVKFIDKTKDEFLKEIIEIVKKYCDNIKLVEPESKEAEVLKDNDVLALTNERERSILSYPTETALLYAVSDVLPKYFYIPNDFELKNSFQNMLVNGYNENNLEILNNFNGWSWDTNLKSKNNIENNLIYQNLLILFGDKFMQNWLECSSTRYNPLEQIKKEFLGTKYFEILCNYLYFVSNERDKKKIDKKLLSKKQELARISDKNKYFENVKLQKIKYFKEVEKIDKLLSNKEALKVKALNEKYTSLSAYKKELQNKRTDYLEKIKDLNYIMKPSNYLQYKKMLEDEISAGNIENFDKYKCMKFLQIEFLRKLKEKALEIENADEIMSSIGKLRYYRFLYFTEDKQIKDDEQISELVNEVLMILVNKACSMEIIRIIADEKFLNFEIIKNILDTKIIDLKEIRFEIISKDGILVKVYEHEVFEKEFRIDATKKDILVKFNKSLKLFI